MSDAQLEQVYAQAVQELVPRMDPASAHAYARRTIGASRERRIDARLLLAAALVEGKVRPGGASLAQLDALATELSRAISEHVREGDRSPLNGIRRALASRRAHTGRDAQKGGSSRERATRDYVHEVLALYRQLVSPEEGTWSPD
jgi:hypothetical protein